MRERRKEKKMSRKIPKERIEIRVDVCGTDIFSSLKKRRRRRRRKTSDERRFICVRSLASTSAD